jgi:hypothetical protein
VRSSSLLTRIAAWGALLSALGASLYLAVAPTYESASVDASTGASASQPPVFIGSATLASVNGPIVFVWFAFCVIAAALPLAFRHTHFARGAALLSAALLLAFVVLGLASIGGMYVPAAAFALLAAVVTPSSRPAT